MWGHCMGGDTEVAVPRAGGGAGQCHPQQHTSTVHPQQHIPSSCTCVSNLIQRTKGKIRQSFQSSAFGIRTCWSPWRQQLPAASQRSCRCRAECFYTAHMTFSTNTEQTQDKVLPAFIYLLVCWWKWSSSKRIRAIKNPMFCYSDWFMASFGSSFIYQVCSFIACLIPGASGVCYLQDAVLLFQNRCTCNRNCSGANITVDLFH